MLGKLRTRYYVIVVGLATLPVLLLGLLAGSQSATELERQSLAVQTELATRIEREIAWFILARINELRILERTNVLAGQSETQLAPSLSRLLAHDQVYQEVLVLTADGHIQAYASRTDIAPHSPEHWRSIPVHRREYWEHHQAFVGRIEFDAKLREPLVDIAVPIIERRTGTISSALIGHVRFRPIWSLLADLELPKGTEALVVAGDGRMLAHRSPSEVLSGRIMDMPAQDGRQRLSDGRTQIVVTRALSLVASPTFIVVTRPLDLALEKADELRKTTLISAVALLLAASALALWLSRQIVRPVEQLASRARKISGGDMNAHIEVSGPEEITALGRTLEEMTKRLTSTIVSLERAEFAERERAMVTLKSIGDAVITADPAGHITYINPVAERLTGWTLADAVDRPLADVFHIVDETTRQPAPDPVARCLETGRIFGLANNTALLSRDGHEYTISDSAAPIREANGDTIGVVMVFQDITERRAMERLLRESQKMESIGRLSGGIAHDFNNLLQVIQGNAELLADDPSLDRELTQPILHATERGAKLTHRLLAYARKQPLQNRIVDVQELLEDLLPILDRTLGETINVSLKIESPVWPVEADPGQLEGALLNVALNARDAMPNGGSLFIRSANASKADFDNKYEGGLDESEFVRISVSDSGEGMTEETRVRATEPFFTTKGVGEGSGLGLSMVHGFAVQTGGHLEIESTMGAGTTVSIFLPRSQTATGPEVTKSVPLLANGNAETVLVVEDSEEVRILAKRTLVGLGYNVLDVGTVAEARALLRTAQSIDLVLTDIVLPGGASGRDLAEELRRDLPGVPIILMSGHFEAAELSDEKVEHQFILLNKPFRRERLAAAVRQALDQRFLQPEIK